MQHPEIKEDLLSRYQAHRDMVNYMRFNILPEIVRYGDKIAGDDGDGNLSYGKLSSLMQEYNAELPRLKEQISEYSARLDNALEKN